MEFLKADYTEVWVPSAIVPLIQFADRVDSLARTGIDAFGIGSTDSEGKLIQRLRCFDEIVSWYGANRAEFRQALKRTGVRCMFHTALPIDASLHASDFFARQVGAPLGRIPCLRFAGAEARGSLVMHPFSGSAKKNWPLLKFRQLAEELRLPVEWLAGPEEQLAEAVRFDDLGQLAQWLTGARLYVGNDSGITHLAAAVGVPTFALFGDTDPHVWRPRGENVRWLRFKPLEALGVAEVGEEILSVF